MRSGCFVGMGILGLSVCFLVSGCGSGGLGEAKVKEIGEKKVQAMTNIVKAYKDYQETPNKAELEKKKEENKKANEEINAERKKFSPDDDTLWRKFVDPKLAPLEKEFNEVVNEVEPSKKKEPKKN